MGYLIFVVFMIHAFASRGLVANFIQQTSSLISSELQVIKDPIDQTIVNVLSDHCTAIKNLIGENYNQSASPDLSQLSLDFLTREIFISYKLSAAAQLIPTSRWFKCQKEVIIYIHGFTDNPAKESYRNISRAFLMRGDYNVLALDSSSLLDVSTLYVGATTNVRHIGKELGTVLANMLKVGSQPLSFYLIGHSLGAHIAGFTGKYFTSLTGHLVGRITGLDPAGPCYTTVDDDLKLAASDAQFVDVIHTDAGVYGLDEPRGHADFYPNGGSAQPDCLLQICSHSRAWQLYAETVMFPTDMPALRCDSWEDYKKGQCFYGDVSYMGFGCSSKTRGKYYLQTRGSIPYGLGANGTSFMNEGGVIWSIGSALGII